MERNQSPKVKKVVNQFALYTEQVTNNKTDCLFVY